MRGVGTSSILGLAAIALTSLTAAAQDSKSLGRFRDWDAFSYKEGSGKVCYLVSMPKDKKPKGVRRGKVYVMVTHRTARKVVDVVSVVAGYPYKEKGEVEITIGGHEFQLFTQGENAWTRDAKADKALVRAMIGGAKMVVRGTSRRGTLTTDTYSLTGFTAAHEAIDVACGVRK